MNTCGQCWFGRVMKEDVTSRLCHGAPPSPIAVPHPRGLKINMIRPVVGAKDEACALFKARLVPGHTEAVNTAGPRTNGS